MTCSRFFWLCHFISSYIKNLKERVEILITFGDESVGASSRDFNSLLVG